MTIYATGEQLGSVCRECLDRLIALSKPHLRSKRKEWVTHCDRVRPLGAGRLASGILARARIRLMECLLSTGYATKLSGCLSRALIGVRPAPAVRARALGAAILSMLVAGCSPYIYKSEINGFAAGVEQIGAAYQSGLKSTGGERLERQRWEWATTRARIALTEGCVPSAPGAPDMGGACALREVGKASPAPSQIERQAVAAAPIVKGLRDYADALAAVTNAEDQQTLEAAQARFRGSIESLAKQRDPALGTSLGPIVDVFSAVTTAVLNARRFEILKDGVSAANEPVVQLGSAMGEVLDAIRTARTNELRLTADFLVAELGPAFGSAEYVSRLDLVEGKVGALEALRRSNPRQAAQDLVSAHEALARALKDDRRQAQAVVAAVRAFVDKAKEVREAFSG